MGISHDSYMIELKILGSLRKSAQHIFPVIYLIIEGIGSINKRNATYLRNHFYEIAEKAVCYLLRYRVSSAWQAQNDQ